MRAERIDMLPVVFAFFSHSACWLTWKAYRLKIEAPWEPFALLAVLFALGGLWVGWRRVQTRLTWPFRATNLLGLCLAVPQLGVRVCVVLVVCVCVASYFPCRDSFPAKGARFARHV